MPSHCRARLARRHTQRVLARIGSDGIELISSKACIVFSAEHADVKLMRRYLMAGAVKWPHRAGSIDKATLHQAVDSQRYLTLDEYPELPD